MKTSTFAAVMLIALIATSVFFSMFLLGCKSQPTPSKVDVECTKEEPYIVQVPYNETEFYYVKEGVGRPFCSEEPYTGFELNVVSLGKLCQIYIHNFGNITGEWTIKAKFIENEAGGGQETAPITKEIKAGETAKFDFIYNGQYTPLSCRNVNVKVPSVEVCKYTFYQNVRKSKIVTKYKNETRYRTVPCE
ncbi:MAG: hypothetical protein N3D84_02725 [Candidatus Woesearchaeota archaeon]|nr:hypothetical protein [Candidatus Woesearchaeota archaeon]